MYKSNILSESNFLYQNHQYLYKKYLQVVLLQRETPPNKFRSKISQPPIIELRRIRKVPTVPPSSVQPVKDLAHNHRQIRVTACTLAFEATPNNKIPTNLGHWLGHLGRWRLPFRTLRLLALASIRVVAHVRCRPSALARN